MADSGTPSGRGRRMRRSRSVRVVSLVALVAGTLFLTGGSPAQASPTTVIHVPGDQPTIQAAIDAAVDGDVVAVDPGTYQENINLEGKAIKIASTSGPSGTIIDG